MVIDLVEESNAPHLAVIDHDLCSRINTVLRHNISFNLPQATKARSSIENMENEEIRELYVDGLIIPIHRIFCSFEAIWKDIAREIDGGKPLGSGYDERLLAQMAQATGYRPAMIDAPENFRDLMQVRNAFRNFDRSVTIDTIRLISVLEDLAMPDVMQGLERLQATLGVEVVFVDPFTGTEGVRSQVESHVRTSSEHDQVSGPE